MKEKTNIIGQYLRAKREEAGIFQRDVAKHAGVSESTISRIESGEVLPTVDVLVRIGEYLGLDLTELLTRLGNHAKQELPELEEYLREKYGLTEDTIDSVRVYFRQVTQLPRSGDRVHIDDRRGGEKA